MNEKPQSYLESNICLKSHFACIDLAMTEAYIVGYNMREYIAYRVRVMFGFYGSNRHFGLWCRGYG